MEEEAALSQKVAEATATSTENESEESSQTSQLAEKKGQHEAAHLESLEAKRRHEEERLRREEKRRVYEEELERLRRRKAAEEERRRKEREAQKKLRQMGVCPVGYRWIKQAAGYRCAGGSHFVSDAELGV